MVFPNFLVFVGCLFYQAYALANFQEIFAWNELEFVWPSETAKNNAIRNGEYIPGNNCPLGMDGWGDKLFVTIPRWKAGTAATLGYIPLSQPYTKSPAIIPYPNWKANTLPKGNAKPDDGDIISSFRVAVDACDRLWIMDMGLADLLGNIKVFAKPAIVIYNLRTNQLIRRYVLPDNVKGSKSFFPNIVIDSNKDKCEDTHAYIPDVQEYTLIVYSFRNNDSWRFKHNYFHLDPLRAEYFASGVSFQWTDGVFGLALGPEDQNNFRTVYFHPTGSLNEFSVSNAVLKNKSLTVDPHLLATRYHHLFKFEGTRGENTQSTSSIFDQESNTLFLTQINKDGIACWNPSRPLNPENVALIAQDHENLSFTNEIRIDASRQMWLLSNKMPRFIYQSLNGQEVNYRIYRVKVDDAIAGTPCECRLPPVYYLYDY